VIGSNKITLYGMPLLMARYSELIKTQLTIYANSPEPYPLLTHGVILERPILEVWFYINDVMQDWRHVNGLKDNLSLTEMFQLYRLFGYFGIDTSVFNRIATVIINGIGSRIANYEEKDRKAIGENKDTIVKLVNGLWEQGVGSSTMQSLINNLPDVLDRLNVIPLLKIERKDPARPVVYFTLKRNILNDKKDFEKEMKQRGYRIVGDDIYEDLYGVLYQLVRFGPDKIILEEQDKSKSLSLSL
jgi:hypothetical protein